MASMKKLHLGKGNKHHSLLVKWITYIVRMFHSVLQFPLIQFSLQLFMEYVDLGKCVAALEWGLHSGLDLLPLIFFNCTAGLWQYLANRICLVTGKNLAQVCYEEYSRLACTLLGITIELSIIASDLTKILGVAHAFSMLFELDLLSCTFLAAAVSVMLPVVSHSGSHKLKVLYHGMTIFTSLFYMLGVHFSSLGASSDNTDSSPNLMNAFTTMALLGAQIMPQNFYIHSSSEQQHGSQPNKNMGALIRSNLFAIISIFATNFLVNYVLLNSVASVYNNYGFPLPSFEDAFFLMDQIFRSSATPFPFWLIFFFSSIITAITLDRMRKVIIRDFFHVNIPCWSPHIIVSVLAIILVFSCTKKAGLAGIYPMLLFSQVISAILLPASMVPIFQLSSSRSTMGAFKISSTIEFLSMVAFIGVLTTNLIFILELLFGGSGWKVDLRGNVASDFTLLYFFIIFLSLASLCFTLYLFITSLRSSDKELTKQLGPRENNDSFRSDNEIFLNSSFDHQRGGSNPESLLGNSITSDLTVQTNVACDLDQTSCTADFNNNEVSAGAFTNGLKALEANVIPYVTAEDSRQVSLTGPLEFSGPMTSDKRVNDVNRNEKISGLTRGAKRQFAAILDEFWGLLFDYHGNFTDEAKNIKATFLLNLGVEQSPTTIYAESAGSQKSQVDSHIHLTFPSVSSHIRNSLMTHSFPSAPSNYLLHTVPSTESQDWRATNYGGFLAQKSSHPSDPPINGSKTEVVRQECADNEDGFSKSIHEILDCNNTLSKNHNSQSWGMTRGDELIYNPSETLKWGGKNICSVAGVPKDFLTYGESERLLLQSLRFCIWKLLGIDSSSWLFWQGGGYDEELIDNLAMTEMLLQKDSPLNVDDGMVIFVPNVLNCGENCIWEASLVVSFGVWCVHRILEFLLVEDRPELWGKYTYVLNRLQGILYPAFCKPREASSPCKCLQLSNNSKGGSGITNLTSKTSILDLIKGSESSISKCNGRVGTSAGNIAFPKGKQNVASVLKRYRRRLTKLSS